MEQIPTTLRITIFWTATEVDGSSEKNVSTPLGWRERARYPQHMDHLRSRKKETADILRQIYVICSTETESSLRQIQIQ